MRIGCLHTASSNVAVFDAARAALGPTPVALRHEVRPDLLAEAERAGGVAPALATRTEAALAALAETTDVVLLTCSTLGPIADAMVGARRPVLRTDAALARAAVQAGRRVVVVCAAPTTLAPTRALFEAAARGTGASVTIHHVAHAWDRFKTGDHAAYRDLVAAAADEAAAVGTIVALAQASMASALSLTRRHPAPLTSPAAGLRAAIESTRHGRSPCT